MPFPSLRTLPRAMKAIVTTVALLLCGNAYAILVTFDELPYVPSVSGHFADYPVTNQYQSLGLLISGGYLAQGGDAVVSSPNYLLGSALQLTFKFIDPLPTFVGMYVSAAHKDVIYVSASGAAGLIGTAATTGYAGPFNDTPYVPQQYISFSSAAGISNVSLSGFYNQRVDAQVDNLTFTSAVAIPEPSSIALLGIGLVGFFGVRLRKR